MLDKLFEQNKELFTKSDYKIMEYLMRHKQDLQYLTTEDLVKSLEVSTSTISRFWSKIGFANMKEFKRQMRAAMLSTPSSRTSSALKQWKEMDRNLDEAGLRYEKQIVYTLEQLHPEALEKTVQYMMKSRKIYLFATDASAGLGNILEYRCRRLGIEFLTIRPGSGIYESIVNLGSRDLVMMFSYSRILTEIQILLQHAGMVHYKTVLFTDLLVSPEIEQADVVLYSYRGEPSEYHSMAAPMVIVDLLIMNLMRERGDSVERAGYLEKLREKYAALIKR